MTPHGVELNKRARLVWWLNKLLLWQRDVIAEHYFCEEHLPTVLSSKSIAGAVACVLGEVDSSSPHATLLTVSHVESLLALDDDRGISGRRSVPQ